jgi:hypothetical protein
MPRWIRWPFSSAAAGMIHQDLTGGGDKEASLIVGCTGEAGLRENTRATQMVGLIAERQQSVGTLFHY